MASKALLFALLPLIISAFAITEFINNVRNFPANIGLRALPL